MKQWLLIGLLSLVVVQSKADEATIVDVVFQKTSTSMWRVDTTLRHTDTGWEHYADAWRVVDTDGNELGIRILLHPHVNEQPFTRSVQLTIPESVIKVFVEARDKVHGWNRDRVAVDLLADKGERFVVR